MSAYTVGLRPEQIDDIVENTLDIYERDKFVDISTNLQQYFAMDNMLLGDRVEVRGGTNCQWQVKVRNSGAAHNTGLYATDKVTVLDLVKHASVPWTMQTTNFAYDINEEAFNNPTAVRILDIMKPRVHSALTSLAELMEENFWGLPQNTTDETELKKPRGVPYWIVRNATKGFNGSVPIGGGHTTVGGLNPTTYTNWRNFTGQYSAISTNDFVRLAREAHRKCHFKEPVNHAGKATMPRYVCCTTYEVTARLEELLETRNENLGRDVAWADNGDVLFRRTPVKWVPKLDDIHDSTGADSTNHYGKNPFYGIDRNVFKAVIQAGRFMKRSKALVAPNQHTVRHVHYDSFTAFKCTNRRCNFVITQS